MSFNDIHYRSGKRTVKVLIVKNTKKQKKNVVVTVIFQGNKYVLNFTVNKF